MVMLSRAKAWGRNMRIVHLRTKGWQMEARGLRHPGGSSSCWAVAPLVVFWVWVAALPVVATRHSVNCQSEELRSTATAKAVLIISCSLFAIQYMSHHVDY